jgi:hypothetical protein
MRKITFATVLTILSASVGLLPMAASAQGSEPVFKNVVGEACPSGSVLVTYNEALKFRASLAKILGTWDIARLANGSMDGGGYSFKVRPSDNRTLGNALCKELSLAPLVQYYSPVRGDNFVTATPAGVESVGQEVEKIINAKYFKVRTEACVFSQQQPDTVPLNLYWSESRKDNFVTATAAGAKSATDAGYAFIRVEGYVYSSPKTGTVPLSTYYSPQRGDNFTTATAESVNSATEAGYTLVERVEGYAFPASNCK